MVMDFEIFIESTYGMWVGFLFILMGVYAFMKGYDKPRSRRSMTGLILYVGLAVLGAYIVLLHFRFIDW